MLEGTTTSQEKNTVVKANRNIKTRDGGKRIKGDIKGWFIERRSGQR